MDDDDGGLLTMTPVQPPLAANDNPAALPLCATDEYQAFVATVAPDKSGRSRLSFRFHLNLRLAHDYSLARWLDEMKAARQYSRVIHDALDLYRDCRAGQYGVFKRLFPAVYQRILDENCTPASDQFNALMKEIAELKAAQQTPRTPAPDSNRPVVSTQVDDAPVQLTIRKAKSSGNSAANFLQAAYGLIE